MVKNPEIFSNLEIIQAQVFNKMLQSQNLLKLIRYDDDDPLNNEDIANPKALLYTSSKIQDTEIYRIYAIPKIPDLSKFAKTFIIPIFELGDSVEGSTKVSHRLIFTIGVPLSRWLLKDNKVRFISIMKEIEKMLYNNQEFQTIGSPTFEKYKKQSVGRTDWIVYNLFYNFVTLT